MLSRILASGIIAGKALDTKQHDHRNLMLVEFNVKIKIVDMADIKTLEMFKLLQNV